MDKKSLLAIVLITVVILTLPYYYNLIYDEPVIEDPEAVLGRDHIAELEDLEHLRLRPLVRLAIAGTFRIEHFELDGMARLAFLLRRTVE